MPEWGILDSATTIDETTMDETVADETATDETAADETTAGEDDPPTRSASLRRTWGLGTTAAVLCALLGVSGLVLMFYYRPEPALASLSLLDLEAAGPFGFLRGVHFWASRALVMVVWLHLFRVLVREAFRPPGHGHWLVGLGLLLLTLALAHTGSLLPWEGTARDPGAGEAKRLLTVYALHCAVLPAAFFAGVGWHVWRLRRDAGGAL